MKSVSPLVPLTRELEGLDYGLLRRIQGCKPRSVPPAQPSPLSLAPILGPLVYRRAHEAVW